MSGVIVHTIPPQKPTVFGGDSREIVGISRPEGGELWIPTGGKGPAYSDYDPLDSTEQVLALDETLGRRLSSFFEKCILPNVRMRKTAPGRWDCHSFALWMEGRVTDPEEIDLDETEAIEDGRVQDGTKIKPRTLRLGELGIIGGRNDKAAIADHSVIGLEKGRGLQVIGRHRPLAIVGHEKAIKAYKTVSRGRFSDSEYGMYAVSRRQRTLTRGRRKRAGGRERT